MPKIKADKKTKNILIKVNDTEYQDILAKANTYTDGNISKWIRYAAIYLEPKEEDLEK